jgi:hypothetical protein
MTTGRINQVTILCPDNGRPRAEAVGDLGPLAGDGSFCTEVLAFL